MRRHVYYYTHLLERCEQARSTFARDPALWLPSPASLTDEGWLVELHAAGVLPDALSSCIAEVRVSAPALAKDTVVRQVSWHAAAADRLFPVLSGDLELTRLPERGCHLSLTATYRPPLTVVGGAADRVLGHRVAEACVRKFVLEIEGRLALATLPV